MQRLLEITIKQYTVGQKKFTFWAKMSNAGFQGAFWTAKYESEVSILIECPVPQLLGVSLKIEVSICCSHTS